jgi:hypothetical protein
VAALSVFFLPLCKSGRALHRPAKRRLMKLRLDTTIGYEPH